MRVPLLARCLPLAFVALLIIPSAQASLIPSYDYEAVIPPLNIVPKQQSPGAPRPELNLTMLSGAYEGSGSVRGAFAVLNAQSGAITGTERIEVVNTTDRQGAIGRFTRGECQSASACTVERTFTAGELRVGANASVILYSETTNLSFTVSSPFAMALFVNASAALRSGPLGNVPVNHSTLLVGDRVTLAGTTATSTNNLYAVAANPNVTMMVSSGSESQTYRGQQYVFRIYGTPHYDLSGVSVATPLVNGTSGIFRRASASELKDGFRPESLNNASRALGGQDLMPKQLADGLRDLGPILNGAVLGKARFPVVDGKEANSTDLAIVRFARGEVTVQGSSAHIQAHGEFILLGDQGFYTTKKGLEMGFLRMPALSIVLWLVAAAAIVLGFVLKPLLVGSGQVGGFGSVRLLGILVHVLAFVLAFILWDMEFKTFLGTSFLSIFFESAFGRGTILAITAFLEFIAFGFCNLLFGMPVRFIVNSGLKLGGLKKARGVGKGVGNLAVWGIGAPFIPFVLNGFVGAIIDILQKSLGST